jgi:para-nitrobenzyl esterase
MQLPFPSDAAPLGVFPAEDCLYLNIWKPQAASAAKLPVIVWIYGGGFVNGGASPAVYSGANLAAQGVIFVSFNYRLGRFGTFAHPQLTRAAPDGPLLGNYGYMDQLAALRWVNRNIAAFGGDPANVTLVGESAGGMSVHALLTSPMGKDLFQRAVIMSGGDGAPLGPIDLGVVEQAAVRFAAAQGIPADDPQALTKLRALRPDRITDGLNLTQFGAAGPGTYAPPFNDGALAVDAGAAYRDGAFPKIPIMIGATDADIGGDSGPMIAGARALAGAAAGQGAPVYAYRFSYVAQALNRTGASHASDIPFFLDTASVKYGFQTSARDKAMAKSISGYVVNFARTGDPNGANLPLWPRYNPEKDEIMDFARNGQAEAKRDPLTAPQP